MDIPTDLVPSSMMSQPEVTEVSRPLSHSENETLAAELSEPLSYFLIES